MNDTVTTPEVETAKTQTVLDDMPQRQIFENTDDATTYINKCQEDYADFGGYPVAAVGLTDEGAFDPAVYTEDMRVAVSVVTQRGKTLANPTPDTIVHCIAIYPMPKLAAILGLAPDVEISNKTGLAWLESTMETQFNHEAVRNLRKATNAEEIAEAVDSMPASVEDYTTSGRESTSGILETYNQTWQLIKKMLGQASKAFALRNFSKKELRKAMESASYASAVYQNLEDRVNAAGEAESWFKVAATLGVMLAKEQGLDPTIFDRMLEQRAERDIAAPEDEEEFDLEAAMAKMAAASAPAAE